MLNFLTENYVKDLRDFYDGIYVKCFPDPDEREEFSNILSYLEQGKKSSNYNYYIVISKDDTGNIVGGCIFNYFLDINSGVIEFIAVSPDKQSLGLGTKLYDSVVSTLQGDSQKYYQKPLDFIFCEIDSPELSSDPIKKYLNFYRKNGYKHLNFNYIQPSLSSTQKPVNKLWIIMNPMGKELNSINKDIVLSMLKDYFKYAMSIYIPECSKEYLQIFEELKDTEQIMLLDI